MNERGPGPGGPESWARAAFPTVDLGLAGYVDTVEIGRGGFGVVYRARQPRFGRTVAIKILAAPQVDEQARARFERELQAMGRLSGHPHIVTVHEAGFTAAGQPYIVMGYEANGSLGDRLRRTGPLPWSEAVSVGVKLAGALETAHRMQILHRDVKPENVLVSMYGQPKLADFGVARIVGIDHTRTGMVTASVPYAAPEILSGVAPSVQSDVYALATTVAALIVGRPPFVAPTDEGLIPLIVRITRDPLPDLRPYGAPDVVQAVLDGATAKAAGDRPGSALDFGQSLQKAQAVGGLSQTELLLLDDPRDMGATTAALSSPATVPIAAPPMADPDDPTVTVMPAVRTAEDHVSRLDDMPPTVDVDMVPVVTMPAPAPPAWPGAGVSAPHPVVVTDLRAAAGFVIPPWIGSAMAIVAGIVMGIGEHLVGKVAYDDGADTIRQAFLNARIGYEYGQSFVPSVAALVITATAAALLLPAARRGRRTLVAAAVVAVCACVGLGFAGAGLGYIYTSHRGQSLVLAGGSLALLASLAMILSVPKRRPSGL